LKGGWNFLAAKNYLKGKEVPFLRTGSHSVKVNDIGHSFIIKGYLINEEDDLYFEVYDPSSLAQKYLDGNFIGKNRYYHADEVINSMGEDNPYPYIMIQK
jgi:hypothetical protein